MEEEIDQFCFDEEERAPDKPVELSDFETESDRLSTTQVPKLVITRIDSSSIEEEQMDLRKDPA